MDKPVLVNLCDRAQADGRGVFMSRQTLANETCLHLVTAHKAIQRLLTAGFIKRVGTRPKGIVEYAIVVAALRWERWAQPAPGSSTSSPRQPLPTATPVAHGYTDPLPTATPSSSPRLHKPLSEPLSEPKREESAQVGILQRPSVKTGSHVRHALCGRVCMHASQHEPFVKNLNINNDKSAAEKKITTWFEQVEKAYEGKVIPESNPFKFWDAEYVVKFGNGGKKPEPRSNVPSAAESDRKRREMHELIERLKREDEAKAIAGETVDAGLKAFQQLQKERLDSKLSGAFK